VADGEPLLLNLDLVGAHQLPGDGAYHCIVF
jgi:hypothetical protein